jgi:hypothetical protein
MNDRRRWVAGCGGLDPSYRDALEDFGTWGRRLAILYYRDL